MTEEIKKKIENVYKHSSNSIEKIEAAKFGYAIASHEHREEVERLKARVKELEGLVQKAFYAGEDGDYWEIFKTENNL